MAAAGGLRAATSHCTLDGVQPVYVATDAAGVEDFMAFLKGTMAIRILSESADGNELVFELTGVDAPIANALRRILLAEVPSVAIEHVYISKNTSILQDEILALRLGLVPLKVDPRRVEWKKPGDDPTDLNTIVYRMAVTGTRKAPAGGGASLEGEEDVDGPFTSVYSSALVWDPVGGQEERFAAAAAPVSGDILLSKLAPGQEIELEAHAVKGVGKDHAKFSPVATAAYRLLPRITLQREFAGEEAERLKAVCPMRVFDIEDLGGGAKRGVVKRPRDCTVCRECIRQPGWADAIRIERVNNHFIFSVESTGALPAKSLVQEACRLLAEKAREVVAAVDAAAAVHGRGPADAPTGPGGLPQLDPGKAAFVTQAAMRNPEDEETI